MLLCIHIYIDVIICNSPCTERIPVNREWGSMAPEEVVVGRVIQQAESQAFSGGSQK
jgi:hypothetical protein